MSKRLVKVLKQTKHSWQHYLGQTYFPVFLDQKCISLAQINNVKFTSFRPCHRFVFPIPIVGLSGHVQFCIVELRCRLTAKVIKIMS